MVKVFVDSNTLFDLIERNKGKRKEVDKHLVYVSPLSFHIFFYTNKYKVPKVEISKYKDEFYIVNFTDKILTQALQGPTKDLEDNIQLHSAAEAECDYFLTNDKNLLKMKFFGKTRIADNLS